MPSDDAGWIPAPGNTPHLLPDDVDMRITANVRRHHCDAPDCHVIFDTDDVEWWYRERDGVETETTLRLPWWRDWRILVPLALIVVSVAMFVLLGVWVIP